MSDSRNVTDEFKNLAHDEIVAQLDKRGIELEIAIENTLRDYNMGSIVRSANAFGVRTVHVIGRKQWNKRGAMMTDKYLSVVYHSSIRDFVSIIRDKQKNIIAIDNVEGSVVLAQVKLPLNAVLVFGQEGPGLSKDLIKEADQIVAIEQFGSTRSINVASAAAVVMYEWLRTNKLATD